MAGHFLDLKLWLAGAVFAACGMSIAMGQTGAGNGNATVSPPQTVEAALHEMSDAAGVIFTGQVMLVHPVTGAGGAGGVVEVTFHVDQAVKGCASGGVYVLREWAGLWSGGNARYRVGQRFLMLIRTPGTAGMSSPVGGTDGAIPIRGGLTDIVAGGPVVGAANVAPGGPDAGSAAAMVDLRWVAARILQNAPYMTTPGTVGATSVDGGAPGSGAGASGSVAAAGASVGTVLGMLSSWEAELAAQ